MTRPYVWWKHGVIYQIYPRSFMDANGDGVGDLQGIIDRLDYLEALGVDAIWISPIYPSPMADFGYDVADYTDVNPLFGDLATFDRLLEAAHARGLRIVLDFVPNHSSEQHAWFIEARASTDSATRDWYIWKDPAPEGGPPNNWESFFGGSAWELDDATGQYYLHLFLKEQPDLNWRNPAVVTAMHDNLRFWLDKGVDGFRIDVVGFMIKHPDFPDNPPVAAEQREESLTNTLEHKYDIDQPEIHDVIRAMRKVFDSYDGDRVMIGETAFLEPETLARYYGTDLDGLHVPFNFTLHWRATWNPAHMRELIQPYYDALPPGAMPNFVIGSHDRVRPATRYGRENARGAMLMLLTLWGIPTIYYGDEIAMIDVPVPRAQWQDPWGINFPESGVNRDPQRTPMQWDASPNAGFCPPSATPWLPLADDSDRVNVAAQNGNPNSMLSMTRKLLKLRHAMEVLHATGDFAFVTDGVPDGVLAYTRKLDDEYVLIAINFSGAEQRCVLGVLGEAADVLFNTHMDRPGPVELSLLTLRPREGLLLQLGREEIDVLVAQITDDNRHDEVDWGPPVGNEIW